jgi:hypothetical protein
MSGVDSFVQVAADGSGKKVATEEFTRADGTLVEAQQILSSDPLTGRPLDAPPWAQLLEYQRQIVIELRVISTLLAEETRTTDRQLDDLRALFERDLR